MNRVLTFMMMTILVASAFPLNATADASDDIPTNAAGTGVHGSLLAALTHVGLNTTLEGTGPFTCLLRQTKPSMMLALIWQTSDSGRERYANRYFALSRCSSICSI